MEHAHEHGYHPPITLYYKVFGALIILTGITVIVAFQDFGVFNNIVALGIAGVKTTLVVLFFMHVKYESRLTKLFAAAGFFWLAILMAFTLQDTETRLHNPGPKGWAPLPQVIIPPPAVSGLEPAQQGEHAAPTSASSTSH